MVDKRISVKDILKKESKVDVLLINTPSTFYKNENKIKAHHKSSYEYLDYASNNSSMMYGDQDNEPNHGLLLILSYLKNNNISSDIADINTMLSLEDKGYIEFDDKNYIEESIRKRSPSIIGISSMTPNLHIAKEYSNYIKNKFPNVILILGGMATTDVVDCFNDSQFNIVIKGEGEFVFLNLISRLLDNEFYENTTVIYRDNSIEKKLKKSAKKNEIIWHKNNDTIPNYASLPIELKLIPRVFSARGCGNACGFCSPAEFFGGKVKMRSPQKVIEEIEYLHNNYDFEWFLIGDLNFYINSTQAQLLLDKLIKFKPKGWWCQLEATFLNKSNVAKLKEANCKQVAIGFEDFNTAEKSISRKNGGKDTAMKICRLLKDEEILVQCYWVFGLPNDTFESSLKKLGDIAEFIREGLIDTVHISYMIPYPNIPYMEIYDNVTVFSNNYKSSLGSQNSYYTAMPMHRTSNLSSNEIYLLNQLAISICANEYFILGKGK